MKTDSQVNFNRVKQAITTRFNPLRSLTPQGLATQLDDFRRGYFLNVAQTLDIMERRDDTLCTVAKKRKRSVGRHGWEIITVDDSPLASRQAELLEDFWNNIRVSHALKRNLSGGWGTLCEQMLDAIGKEYAAHELIWKPARKGGVLGCTFNFVPLWFFEATEGELRYLPTAGLTQGEPLEDDAWMVTCGDGIMEAAAVNYMFKRLPLQDWLGYSEKYGFPWPHLQTTATFGSDEWTAAVDAMANFLNDGSIVTSSGQEIEFHEAKGQGPQVFKDLVERMDRAMVMLWRGSDLSTMSAGDSVGASVQGEETDLIEADDALLIEDTLNSQVNPFVLRYHFGSGVESLAYIKVKTGSRTDDKADLEKWKLGAELGVPLSVTDYRERFSLPTPDDGDELLQKPETRSQEPEDSSQTTDTEAANAATDRAEQINEQLLESADVRIDAAFLGTHRRLAERFEDLIKITDEAEFRRQLADLRSELPNYIAQPTDALTRAYQDTLGAALINGAAEGATTQPSPETTDEN